MTWSTVPFFVDGAVHPAEIMRLLAFAATGGKEGVVSPGDCKVVPLATPGAGVQVSVGAVIVLNRATSGQQQTYMAKNPTSDTVGVTASGSGAGKSDLVVAMIEDPNMPGNSKYAANVTDPKTGPYVWTRIVPNVPAGTTRLQDVPGHELESGIALARIDFPASTGTVTAAMITDLRKLALARSETQNIIGTPTDDQVTLSTTTWSAFPKNKLSGIVVPDWATHAVIRVDTTLRYISGDAYANFQAFMGPSGQQDSVTLFADSIIDTTTTGGSYRQPVVIPSDRAFAIPAAWRGKTVEISSRVRGKQNGGKISGGASDYYVAQITFQERAA